MTSRPRQNLFTEGGCRLSPLGHRGRYQAACLLTHIGYHCWFLNSRIFIRRVQTWVFGAKFRCKFRSGFMFILFLTCKLTIVFSRPTFICIWDCSGILLWFIVAKNLHWISAHKFWVSRGSDRISVRSRPGLACDVLFVCLSQLNVSKQIILALADRNSWPLTYSSKWIPTTWGRARAVFFATWAANIRLRSNCGPYRRNTWPQRKARWF